MSNNCVSLQLAEMILEMFRTSGATQIEQLAALDVARAIKQVDGKRLQYGESVDNPPYLPQPKGQANAPFSDDAR